MIVQPTARRRFLQYLAASPLLANTDVLAQEQRLPDPSVWGTRTLGQPGVERVLDLLHQETRAAMMQVGAPSLKQLVPAMVRRAS